MGCTYKFTNLEELSPYTYKELVEYFRENIHNFKDDVVFSMKLTQDLIFEKLLENKLGDNVKIQNTSTLNGEPDYITDNKWTTQTFIDSNSFIVNGVRPIFQLTDEEYLENLKLSLIEDEHIDEKMAEIKAKNLIKNGKLIGNDAKDFHVLINSYDWRHADLQDFIRHCKGTKFENLALPIYNQINDGPNCARRIMYGSHKLNNQSALIISNINLKAYIDVLGEDIFGHFDNIVIDANGNLHVYNYKITTSPISEWKKVKMEKYKYQMALLKQILAANGYNVENIELHIIPVQVKYDDNFENILEVTLHNTDNIELTVEKGKYVFRKYDDVAKHFIKAPTKLDTINNEQLLNINSALSVIFPDRQIKYDGISKTADEWIKQNYNSKMQLRIKQSTNKGYSYELYLNDDYKNPIYIKDSTHPYENEEIKQKVTEHLVELQKSSPIVMNRILQTIGNSRTKGYSTFIQLQGKAFGYAGLHLGKVLDPYFKFEEINGKKIYDWYIIEDDVLTSANMILFKNRETDQINVVVLSPYNLNSRIKFKDRENIMGSYTPDSRSGQLINYKGTFDNIECVRAMTILNEIMPNLKGLDLKLGLLIVVSPADNGLTKFHSMLEFNRECFQEVIKVVKRNVPTFQFTMRFGNIEYIDPIKLVIQQFENIVDTSNTLFSKSEKDEIYNLGFLNVENESSKVIRAKMVRELMLNLVKKYSFLNTSEKNIVEMSKRIGGIECLLSNLYIQLAKALTYYEGLHVNDEPYLNKFEKDFFVQTRVPNRTYLGITKMFTATIDNIASQVNGTFSPIQDYIYEYLEAKGYSTAKNSIVGNQSLQFTNLYKRGLDNLLLMEFRNPYLDSDEFGKLDNAERKFLKRALFTFAKFNCLNKGRDFNFKSYEDPALLKFIEDNKDWYFNVPLMKATQASTLLKGIGAQLKEWSRKAKTLVKKGNQAYQEFVLEKGYEDAVELAEAHENLNLINPFLKGDDPTSREAYLNAHDSDYFEYDLSVLLANYITEHIKVKELNKTLLTAKSVMLQLDLLGESVGNVKGIEQTNKMIADYIKSNIFEQSLMEPVELKIVSWLQPFRKLVSDAYIAGNIVSAFRDTFEGIMQNMTRSIIKYQTDLKPTSVSSAYKEVILGAFNNISSIDKVDLLCKLYRLSNMDIYKIADSVLTSRSGVFNIENWMYATLRAPDFLNRMVLFVARCMQDGSWEAYSVENGHLKYDPKKDARFKAYFEGNESSKEYVEAKTKYFNAIRQYNQEHQDNQISYLDLLPEAYSELEIQNLRSLSNSIYGAYDLSMRAGYEKMAYGWAFGTFSTWMNGIVANYMAKPGTYYDSKVTVEQETDDSGNLMWFLEDGQEAIEYTNEDGSKYYIDVNSGKEIIKTDKWLPIMKRVPYVVQGIYYTLKSIPKAVYNKRFKEDIWNNPVDRQNIIKFSSDLLMGLILWALFQYAFGPLYKEYKKHMKDNPAVLNALAEVTYKGASRSYDGYLGMLNAILYLGENTNPPVYSVPIKITTDLFKTVLGDKTFLQMLHGNVAVFRSFQDTYKAATK